MKILTILEVAELLQIHRDTAYRYVRAGKLPAVKVGRSWRVLQEVLEEWLRERSGRGAESRPKAKPQKKAKNPLIAGLGMFEHGGLTKDLDRALYGDRHT
ncbi:MAG: helix-turn-helix domain-containing protein [candidate division NC10 bacterium]|nr:helix-turn-helix domain-containing protein [candidate division NC10 bacterium]